MWVQCPSIVAGQRRWLLSYSISGGRVDLSHAAGVALASRNPPDGAPTPVTHSGEPHDNNIKRHA
jgi:hypothetical protein